MTSVTTKLNRKIQAFKRVLIPKNTHLRPGGVLDIKNSNNVEIKDIIPKCTTDLQVTDYLYKNLSSYTIYDKISDLSENTLTVTTDYKIIKAPNGRLYTNNVDLISVISGENELIGDLSFQYKKGSTVLPTESPIFNQKFFEDPIAYKGTVFNMLAGGGAARGNYSHWLMDVVPRLYLLKESGYFNEVDWYLVPQYKHDFQKQTLNHFGIKDGQIIEGNKINHIKADAIIGSTHPRGEKSFLLPKWIVDFYQNYFDLDKYSDFKSPKLVYVNRKDSSQRGIIDEDRLISELEKLGFISVQSSDYDFFGKIKLFRNADFIVSSTGAALASLFFSKPNSKVLELFSKSFTHTHYYNISTMIGLEYDCLIFDTQSLATNMKQGLTEHLRVDPEVVVNKIKSMMG